MLTKATIIRAWKDKSFRASLSEEELKGLPPHPSGLIELTDDDLNDVNGGTSTRPFVTACGSGGGLSFIICVM